MSKLHSAALEHLMTGARKKALTDDDGDMDIMRGGERGHDLPAADVKIDGDPRAVNAVASKLGVPTGLSDKFSSGTDEHYAEGGEVAEEPAIPHADVVGALKQHFPDVHKAVMNKLSSRGAGMGAMGTKPLW